MPAVSFSALVRNPAITIGGVLLFYFTLALVNLRAPGLNVEEAISGLAALALLGSPGPWTRYLTWGHWNIPLALHHYHGALLGYLSAPFVYALGPTPEALRIPVILLGGASLALTYLLVRETGGGRLAASLSMVLLATMPSFVVAMRQSVAEAALLFFFSASLCAFHRWWRFGGKWFYLGCFVSGLGLSTNSKFIFCAIALFTAMLLFPILWPRKRPLPVPNLFLAFICVLVGGAPVALYNLSDHWPMITHIKGAFGRTPSGISNFAYWTNLQLRWDTLGQLLDGSGLLRPHTAWRDELWKPRTNPLWRILPFASLLWFLIRWLRGSMRWRRAFFFWSALSLVYLLASPFTLSSFSPIDVFPILALASILSALFIGSIARHPRFRGRQALAASIASATILGNLWVYRDYQAYTVRTGGMGMYTDAVYNAAAWLEDNEIRKPLSLDWGLAQPIAYLSGMRVAPYEPMAVVTDGANGFDEELARLSAGQVVLMHSERFTRNKILLRKFNSWMRAHHFRAMPIAEFKQQDRELVILAYRLQRHTW